MSPFLGVVRRNLAYKVLSVFVAALLWAIANAQQNPHVSGDVYVQPEVIGLTDDMVVKAEPPGGMVSIEGPTAAVTAFKAQPIKATVDVSRARVGGSQLPILYKLPPGVLLSGEPRTAEVTLERKIRTVLNVDVLSDEASAPPGYEFADPAVEPKSVKVSGLAADVARVARAVAVVRTGQSTGDIYQQVDVIAQTQRQQPVEAVQIDPPRVQVRMVLRRAAASKAVLLSAQVEGTPAPGFAVMGYTFTPQTVTLSGTQEELAARSALAVPISVTGLSAPTTRNVRLTLPAGLSLRNSADATVRVRIDVRPIIGPVAPTQPTPKASPTAPAGLPSPSPSPVSAPAAVISTPAPAAPSAAGQ
jgi:YbbR domain-containing protein